MPFCRANGSSASAARRISPAPGRKTRTSPSHPSWCSRRTADATRSASGRSSRASWYSMSTGKARPSLRMPGQPPRNWRNRLALEGGGHHHQAQVGARACLQTRQQRQGQIGGQVPLVKFVEDDRRNAATIRIREQPAQQNALGHETNARARVPPRPRNEPCSRRCGRPPRPSPRPPARRPVARADAAVAAREFRRHPLPPRAAPAVRAWSCPRREAPR